MEHKKESLAYKEVLNNLKNNYYKITKKHAFAYVFKAVKSIKIKYNVIKKNFSIKIAQAKNFNKKM